MSHNSNWAYPLRPSNKIFCDGIKVFHSICTWFALHLTQIVDKKSHYARKCPKLKSLRRLVTLATTFTLMTGALCYLKTHFLHPIPGSSPKKLRKSHDSFNDQYNHNSYDGFKDHTGHDDHDNHSSPNIYSKWNSPMQKNIQRRPKRQSLCSSVLEAKNVLVIVFIEYSDHTDVSSFDSIRATQVHQHQ